jgi:hypothetical protein
MQPRQPGHRSALARLFGGGAPSERAPLEPRWDPLGIELEGEVGWVEDGPAVLPPLPGFGHGPE